MSCHTSDQSDLSPEEIKVALQAMGFHVYQEPVPVEMQLLKLVQVDPNVPAIRLVNFWATWCLPCRKEIPALQKLEQHLKKYPFQLITINLDENPKLADQFIEKNKVMFSVIKDSSLSISQKFGVRQLPSAFLLDKKNRVLGRVIGAVEWDQKEVFSLMKRLSQTS